MSVGVVVKSTDRKVGHGDADKDCRVEDSASMEQEDEEEGDNGYAKVFEAQGSFDEVVLWGHEVVPSEDDPYAKGIEEWISFAETVYIGLSGR